MSLRIEGPGVARVSLIVISKSWKYGTRDLLCTSLMIDQNASKRARERLSRKIECGLEHAEVDFHIATAE